MHVKWLFLQKKPTLTASWSLGTDTRNALPQSLVFLW
jgi:hypothetical protein